ncbi:TPA: hypothetical protein NGS17_000440 [Vibrio parahaemolyticus]|nr:hypothetical protein [Vibrio parahaemolyticus]
MDKDELVKFYLLLSSKWLASFTAVVKKVVLRGNGMGLNCLMGNGLRKGQKKAGSVPCFFY